jgi:hypothetical protein
MGKQERIGAARGVSAGALRHQEALVQDELRRLSRVWCTDAAPGARKRAAGASASTLAGSAAVGSPTG